MKKKILVVDDELSTRESLRMILKDKYTVLTVESGEEAIKSVGKDYPDLIFLDILMPGMDGIKVLRELKEIDKDLIIIVITATKAIETAVTAMKLGAYDYIIKPFNVDEIKLIVEKALRNLDLEKEVQYLRAEVDKTYSFDNIIGKNKAMREVFETIKRIAPRKNNVLIYGDSGTGKELVAKAIHFHSLRRDKPFVAMNCAAIPETLIENELFGHEKGAFTDANSKKIGRFQMADSGTLFLDEIGDLAFSVQAKILRVIQEKEFIPVGGTKSVKVDVRIVAATNKDLEKEVEKGNFRGDLYYRINVVPIFLPPLRERKEDILLLVHHFLKKNAEDHNERVKKASPEVLDIFLNYPWIGNVRELENVIERAVALSKSDTISVEDLPSSLRNMTKINLLKASVLKGEMSFDKAEEEFERDIILSALKDVNYIQSHAAKMLGISKRVLKYKMDKLGIKEKG